MCLNTLINTFHCVDKMDNKRFKMDIMEVYVRTILDSSNANNTFDRFDSIHVEFKLEIFSSFLTKDSTMDFFCIYSEDKFIGQYNLFAF